ncbi:MAG: DUF885 domain-containing protein [Lachnospiraceae bacterium]
MNKKTSLRLSVFTFILIIAVLIVSLFYHQHKDSILFRHFTDALFVTQLSHDTLSMHYSVAHPEQYGITSYTVQLPSFQEEEYHTHKMMAENYQSTLQHIHPGSLSKQEKLVLAMLLEACEQDLVMSRFDYYDEPLSPGSGMQSQLPILLAEYAFTSKKDIEDYLTLLACIPQYLNSLAEYEGKKAEKGLFMADCSADKVIEQCDVIMDRSLLDNKKHFLISTFDARIKQAVTENLIPKEMAASYQAENLRLLKTVVAPAYQALADAILLLKGDHPQAVGLSAYPDGSAYYTALVHQTTGSDKSIPAIKTLLYKKLQSDCLTLMQLTNEYKESSSQMSAVPFPLLTPETILTDLQKRMETDYPPYPNHASPHYIVKYVDKSLADFVSPAFYLTPPFDDLSENTIYLNEQSIPNALELYTTLAHEGYPGHLYQSVYSLLYQNHAKDLPIRSLLHYGGYSEGWALYVENESFTFAKSLICEQIKEESAQRFLCSYADRYRADRDLKLCLFSLLDIWIHYDGMDYEEITSLLTQMGFKEGSISPALFEYIVEEPANYLKYYLGYQEFLACKSLAKEVWKTNYREELFHRFLLESGPMSFPMLRKCLINSVSDQNYISLKN